VSSLLTASSSSFSFLPFSDPVRIYRICNDSPLYSLEFMDEISSAIKAFVTPAQAEEIVSTVKASLEESIKVCGAVDLRHNKRQKKSDQEGSVASEQLATDVIKFSLASRMTGSALSIISTSSTMNDADKTALFSSLDLLISEALGPTLRHSSLTQPDQPTEKGKRQRSTEPDTIWLRQCVSAAVLRLSYDIFLRRESWRGSNERKIYSKFDDLKETMTKLLLEDILPELQVEIVSSAFHSDPIYQQIVTGSNSVCSDIFGSWKALDLSDNS